MLNTKAHIILVVSFLCLLTTAEVDIEKVSQKVSDKYVEKQISKSTVLPPCQACKALVGSFSKGMERTARNKFDGGDAAWEEEKMKSYRNSEVRLVEIQEKLCTDLEKGEDQCHKLVEDAEPFIEDWWFNKQQDTDLYDFLCIESIKSCCPSEHYGPECKPCPGYPDRVCSSNGRCKGNGTRKGNGACACDSGYTGSVCDSCADGYYQAYKDDKYVLCSPCHVSCQGACTQAGPKGCLACKIGYRMDAEHGCMDMNECSIDDHGPCGSNQFCVNNDGSYSCLDCDRACNGCDGDGPDNCFSCSKGYFMNEQMCVDEAQYSRDRHVVFARYAVYGGLTIATCIIFQNNQKVAFGIGLAVALYIAASEHFISQSNQNAGPKLPMGDASM